MLRERQAVPQVSVVGKEVELGDADADGGGGGEEVGPVVY